MKRMPLLLVFSTILSMVQSSHVTLSEEGSWRKVDEGLHIREFAPPGESKINNSGITIVKINPRFYSFKLICASEHGKTKMTVKQWCREHNHLRNAVLKLDRKFNTNLITFSERSGTTGRLTY